MGKTTELNEYIEAVIRVGATRSCINKLTPDLCDTIMTEYVHTHKQRFGDDEEGPYMYKATDRYYRMSDLARTRVYNRVCAEWNQLRKLVPLETKVYLDSIGFQVDVIEGSAVVSSVCRDV